ncbi:MAG: hypothetical protein KKH73_02455, partial [Actinobacteria bacterium]|nr:hypothetical protein [Actinomycetota bacterium]
KKDIRANRAATIAPRRRCSQLVFSVKMSQRKKRNSARGIVSLTVLDIAFNFTDVTALARGVLFGVSVLTSRPPARGRYFV